MLSVYKSVHIYVHNLNQQS